MLNRETLYISGSKTIIIMTRYVSVVGVSNVIRLLCACVYVVSPQMRWNVGISVLLGHIVFRSTF